MLSWIIQISLISIIFIFLVHHLITFFKTTLTVPKIKDLVNSSEKKYQKIYDTISNHNNSYTSIDLLPNDSNTNNNTNNNNSDISMKDELKSFLKKQLKSENETDNNIVGLSSLNNFSSF